MSERTAPGANVCPRCGAHAHEHECSANPVLTGLIDGRYLVERPIGRGAMGVIALARDTGLGRRVAIKVMAQAFASDHGFLFSFQREAASLARVRSDNVVQVYAFGMHEGSPFFAMEFVDGEDLSRLSDEHLARGETLDARVALDILGAVARGLDAAHAAGVLHCDVKPANVVVERGSGRPVLVDFGLAVSVERARGGLRRAFGTPSYMSPEQARGDCDLGPPTDQYALACTAFELLTGHLPFRAETTDELLRLQIAGTPFSLSSFAPALAALDAPMARALAKDPAYRFEHCSDLIAALAAALSSVAPPSEVEGPPAPSRDGLRVLVVDDDPTFARIAARAAQIAFYRSKLKVDRSADEGGLALEAAPDLLLLDHQLTGASGLDVLLRLRGLPGGRRARVLVVSARIPDGDRLRYRALGVGDFLDKPTDLGALVSTMQGIAADAGWLDAQGGLA